MANKQKNEWDEREIGALWTQEGKTGTYYTGVVNGQRIVIFANKFKDEGGDRPSYRIYKDIAADKKIEKKATHKDEDDLPL